VAKKKANLATLAEVKRAKRFLSLIHAPTTDSLLLIAVVAWMRIEGRGFDVDAAAKRLLKAAIYEPMHASPFGKKYDYTYINAQRRALAEQYALVITAARQAQPADFLYALAISAWDANHFGGFPNNALIKMYQSFTGLTLPASKTKVPKPPPLPTQIAPKLHLPPPTSYIVGYETQGFYLARNGPIPDLPR
jgi:hypothetical protein